MKPKKPTPDPSRKELLAKVKKQGLCDNLTHWVNRTFIAAFRMKAEEIHYIRARDGLTVQFRRGEDVLKAIGPYRRYQDKVIPRLEKMGQSRASRRCKGQTGGFGAVIDDRVVKMPVFHSRTKSGERMVVRFAGSRPYRPA
ncbi:hypothetical protein FJY71_02685 [candidate division WOR-3 bacterium]|nr:hypothetical protein [candidate division WOR-3 bacterium]